MAKSIWSMGINLAHLVHGEVVDATTEGLATASVVTEPVQSPSAAEPLSSGRVRLDTIYWQQSDLEEERAKAEDKLSELSSAAATERKRAFVVDGADEAARPSDGTTFTIIDLDTVNSILLAFAKCKACNGELQIVRDDREFRLAGKLRFGALSQPGGSGPLSQPGGVGALSQLSQESCFLGEELRSQAEGMLSQDSVARGLPGLPPPQKRPQAALAGSNGGDDSEDYSDRQPKLHGGAAGSGETRGSMVDAARAQRVPGVAAADRVQGGASGGAGRSELGRCR
ncbi:hypothetical protein MRX96_003928 [Rhipicephalus microplus]